ncbi:MAG: hypothetical protein HC940_08320 [Acaryochloris sp. SU_5_25]|nr:hypothetical protein [Acaryochloris sp. SU_5_25]
MDSEQLLILKAELQGQMRLIDRTLSRLQTRANRGLDDPALLDSIAYQIHNLYGSIEDLLKQIAIRFENRISETSGWHRSLLLRLSQDIPGVRPALLSEDTFDLLNRLRGFRHFFRHAYDSEIEPSQLQANLQIALAVVPKLREDVENFLGQLQLGVDE